MKQIFTVTKASTLFDSHSQFSRDYELVGTFTNAETAELYCSELEQTESEDNDYEYNIEYSYDYSFIYDSVSEMEQHKQELLDIGLNESIRARRK